MANEYYRNQVDNRHDRLIQEDLGNIDYTEIEFIDGAKDPFWKRFFKGFFKGSWWIIKAVVAVGWVLLKLVIRVFAMLFKLAISAVQI